MKTCYPVCMSHIDFMKHLQSGTKKDPLNAPVTRFYKHAAGADSMIHLPQGYWNYVDWLEARGDIDFTIWVTHCEENPFEDWPVSQLLMYWLWLDNCRRHRYGEATFSDTPPEGYEPYGERANDG